LSMGGTGSGSEGWMLSHLRGISRVGSWKILSSVIGDSFRTISIRPDGAVK
jgi:hypothetical protein